MQDSYSLRCAPQVHGAVRDTLAEARRGFSIELNAATDNPLVFAETNELLNKLAEDIVNPEALMEPELAGASSGR